MNFVQGLKFISEKDFFELVEGRLFYSFEDVLIEDIEDSPRTNWIKNDPAYSYRMKSNELSLKLD